MEKYFKKIKNWQAFLIVILPEITMQFVSLEIIHLIFFIGLLFLAYVQIKFVELSNKIFAGIHKTIIQIFKIYWIFLFTFSLFLVLKNAYIFKVTSKTVFDVKDETLFAVFLGICLYYFLGPYMISKSLVSAEKKKSVKFFDYFKEFLMVILFPIGVWFLIPRINQLFIDNEGKTPNESF